MKIMLDSNCLDALLADDESAGELSNRRDLQLYLTPVQRAELAACPDPTRAARLLALADGLCRLVQAPTDGDLTATASKHRHDGTILQAAGRHHALLVSLDEGLLVAASKLGVPALHWSLFLRKFVWNQTGR